MSKWKLVPVEPTEAMLNAAWNHGSGIVSDYRAMIEAAPTPPSTSKWIPVEECVPECDMEPNSFGVQVLVDPPYTADGYSDMPVAFYGCRQTDEPNFYIYGRVFYPTHWMPLPPSPTDTNPSASISSAETDKSEPSAEAVEAVARAIHAARNGPMSYWHVDAERCGLSRALARAALAADPLRRELGEMVERWQERAREMRMGDEDSGISNAMAIDADVHEGCASELAALLEKHNA